MTQERPEPAPRAASKHTTQESPRAERPLSSALTSTPSIQFSLRMLLGVMTAVAVGLMAAKWLGWRYLRLLIAILVVPFVRLAAAPLAVARNRHR